MIKNQVNSRRLANVLEDIDPLHRKGRVVEAYGTSIKVSGINASIGQQCLISDKNNSHEIFADVVGISGENAILLPLGNIHGIAQNSEVEVIKEKSTIRYSSELIGRILDGMGRPLDNKELPVSSREIPIYRDSPSPMTRKPINKPVTTGIKTIDSTLTLGIGQRTGIFAPAGGGKSTLLSMIARHTETDVIVIALIGERGREVREFVEYTLTEEGLARSVLIISTSDRPAMERLRAAYTATAIAEGFRSEGKNVLLLMDSVTRFARALREIGLSIGEAPVRRGFPSSVFAELPKLFERSGNDDTGTMTAFYTVLIEDEETNDPIAEEVRSLLDGHIILSRKLAQENHYPAIDILSSTSRLINHVTDIDHRACISKLRILLSKYSEIEFLIQVGEYEEGSDNLADEAISKISNIKRFLKQDISEYYPMDDVINQLKNIIID
ncbi:MAG: FliI/YscN family ATPase [Candidatus Thiodiazotropha weberae]|uniref:protein-secreting ATPase n=1 Tax=Candidatus Thiodiazotropha endoloripes TaxID=1818881 RepID=A0A1E2USZ3_9GAMM|nr:FliI/YscN family ATPase [Candidatus Thiodiazotropha endoloripes]MCG7899735.1 FliI/YscN family ATPase [Candidatus Thiodiazotropha weberae]ODB97791.1 flagellum-specific ATP synthase FliI [Candidatus Thiodiazotropha endoloripes]